MLCILYVNAVGALLGIVGLSLERLLPPNIPRRWLWCLTIPLSMFVPGFYRMHHNWVVTDAPRQAATSLAPGLPTTLFDRAWWARTQDRKSVV